MKIADKIIWITGASSGIGEALVYKALDMQAKGVIISSRRLAELKRVKNACGTHAKKVHIAPLDLTDTSEFENLAESIIKEHGRIDILINNGGISQRSWVKDTPMEIDRKIMEVNYFGQIALTKAVLPYMLKQQNGHIGVITSLTGKFGFPLRSAYAASKHALHGFFETLLLELKSEGIGVTLVNPGRVHTQISVNSLTKDGSKYGEMDPGQAKGMPADRCAHLILKAIVRNKAEINMVWPDKVMVYLKRYLPAVFRMAAGRVEPQ